MVTSPPAQVVLRDGSTVCIRPVRAVDRNGLLTMLEGMSPESRQLRSFTAGPDLITDLADGLGLSSPPPKDPGIDPMRPQPAARSFSR